MGCNPGLSGHTRPTHPPGRKKSRRASVCFISLALRQCRAEPSTGLTCVHVWVAKAAERQTAKENTSPLCGDHSCERESSRSLERRRPGSPNKPLSGSLFIVSSVEFTTKQTSGGREKDGFSQHQHNLTVTDYRCG